MSEKIVFLDTNTLLFPLRYKLNITEAIKIELGSETKIMVPDFVVNELERLYYLRKDPKYSFALQLAKHIGIFKTKIKTTSQVDDALISLCLQKNAYLVTLDKKLLRKAIKKGIKTLQLKGKKAFKE